MYQLGVEEASQEQIIKVIDQLQGNCIYCRLIEKADVRGLGHTYKDY
jgi:hypothetical protein